MSEVYHVWKYKSCILSLSSEFQSLMPTEWNKREASGDRERGEPSPNHSVNRALLMGMMKCLAVCVCSLEISDRESRYRLSHLNHLPFPTGNIHHSHHCVYTQETCRQTHTEIHAQPMESNKTGVIQVWQQEGESFISHAWVFSLETGVFMLKCVCMCCEPWHWGEQGWHQHENNHCGPMDPQGFKQKSVELGWKDPLWISGFTAKSCAA